jgi:hypothetical protein
MCHASGVASPAAQSAEACTIMLLCSRHAHAGCMQCALTSPRPPLAPQFLDICI